MDLIELGVHVPFIQYSKLGELNLQDDGINFGYVQANTKLKLMGSSKGPYAISVYANTTLPTTSINLNSRAMAALHTGLAGSTHLLRMFTVGMNVGPWMLFQQGTNTALLNIDLFTAMRIIPMVALQIAWQIAIPLYPSEDNIGGAFLIAPALQFFPTKQVHIDLGGRFAVTDGARIYAGGRAAVIAAVGYDFH